MKKNLFYHLAAGFLFVCILGTLSHFFYEWSGKNFIVGLFTPVNESTWEHMKLLFFPMLIAAYVLKRKLQTEYRCIGSALGLGILSGTFLIPVLFYTYSGILGFHVSAADIGIFYLSVLFAFYITYLYTTNCAAEKYNIFLKSALLVLFLCFLLFTSFPPGIGLFLSPVS